MANIAPLMTSARTGDPEKDEWRTPKWLFDILNDEFNFTLDPAATAENALCSSWYSQDVKSMGNGLITSWFGTAFVNPPYSKLAAWVKKSYEEAYKNNAKVVMLIPARTDTKAWWDYVRWGDVRFLPGRLKFGRSENEIKRIELENIDRAYKGKKLISLTNTATFPSAVVIFEKRETTRYHRPETFYWNIRAPKIEE